MLALFIRAVLKEETKFSIAALFVSCLFDRVAPVVRVCFLNDAGQGYPKIAWLAGRNTPSQILWGIPRMGEINEMCGGQGLQFEFKHLIEGVLKCFRKQRSYLFLFHPI
jgi:hypothetical protein